MRTVTIVLIGCAGLVLAGCGDDDDATSDEPAASDPADDADEETDDTDAPEATDDAEGDADDDGESVDEDDYVDAMIDSFDASDPDELQIDRGQAECLAPQWIEIIGVERMQENGIEPDDLREDSVDVELTEIGLTEDDGNALYDTFSDCDIDIRQIFIDSMSADADDEFTDEQRDCIGESFDDDVLRRIMVTTLIEGDDALDEDDELTGEIFALIGECDLLDNLD
jgi:hypothetical protein